jgi:hypothetical protein
LGLLMVLISFEYADAWVFCRGTDAVVRYRNKTTCPKPEMNITAIVMSDNMMGTHPSSLVSSVWEGHAIRQDGYMTPWELTFGSEDGGVALVQSASTEFTLSFFANDSSSARLLILHLPLIVINGKFYNNYFEGSIDMFERSPSGGWIRNVEETVYLYRVR